MSEKEIVEQKKDKHLYIIDAINNLDEVINSLDILIGCINPGPMAADEETENRIDAISLLEFLNGAPEQVNSRTKCMLERINTIKNLLF